MTALYVTNFNPRITGVSTTAAAMFRAQSGLLDAALVGHPLPGCPDPITRAAAVTRSRDPGDRPFSIWHVRRNPEMRVAIWARDIRRLPIRIVFTSAAQRRHSAYPRWLISRMDAVIATTEEAAGFVPNVRAVIPHGVDTDRFSPATDRANAWAALGYGGARGIATVGRIRPEKGTDLFVDTMIRVLPEHPDVVALVIGKAARDHTRFAEDLKARVASAGLADRILFPGEVAPDDLPTLMRALSLLVAMPRYEGYGMTPLEAMASGTPFVATEAGYYRAFSAQGKTGAVVDQEDVETAAATVSALLANPARLRTMADAAREVAVTHHSVDREARAAIAVYEQLWSGA